LGPRKPACVKLLENARVLKHFRKIELVDDLLHRAGVFDADRLLGVAFKRRAAPLAQFLAAVGHGLQARRQLVAAERRRGNRHHGREHRQGGEARRQRHGIREE
jgi:hypothetical protein